MEIRLGSIGKIIVQPPFKLVGSEGNTNPVSTLDRLAKPNQGKVTLDDVIAIITARYPAFTPTETTIAYWLVYNKKNDWIAQKLGAEDGRPRSIRTAETHVRNILGKLGDVGCREAAGDIISVTLREEGLRELPFPD